jgi:hypothetical protein
MKKNMNPFFTVTVSWFDKSSGVGMVKLPDGQHGPSVPLYACNIPGRRSWFAETACMYFNAGDKVECYIDSGLLVAVTPGEFDQEKFDAINWDNASFKCNDDGQLLNGLFA